MTDTQASTPSLTDKTRSINAGTQVVGVHLLRDTAVFVLAEESVLLIKPDDSEQKVTLHGGAILSSAADNKKVITGGDDGKVVAIDASGTTETVITDEKRRWIDRVALAADGSVAWSAGKQVFVRTGKGEVRTTEVASTVGGLAFAPKGFRLAIAHYNGASLWFPNARDARPETLEWKGSHLDVTFHPDGKFLVTSMQESMLHGWRLDDRKNMRMSGYSGRVRSMSWTAGGKWLATSGSTQLILWPFQGKDGPMGKQPKLAAPGDSRAEVVAAHPDRDVVAVGFSDGLILLVRIEDGAEILIRKPTGAPVSAMAWNASGSMLAWGTEDGEAGRLDLN